MKLKHIKVSDRDIVRDLIIESWETIYPNISLIDNSVIKDDNIVCDLIGTCKDSNKPVYGFIETTDHNASLSNIVSSFNWIKENQYLLNKAYSDSSLEINNLPLFLVIVPGFSPNFLTSLTYLNVPGIHLYQFFCMEVNGEKGIMLEEIKLPDKKTSSMNNEEQRNSFNVCLECLGLTSEEEKDLLSPLD